VLLQYGPLGSDWADGCQCNHTGRHIKGALVLFFFPFHFTVSTYLHVPWRAWLRKDKRAKMELAPLRHSFASNIPPEATGEGSEVGYHPIAAMRAPRPCDPSSRQMGGGDHGFCVWFYFSSLSFRCFSTSLLSDQRDLGRLPSRWVQDDIISIDHRTRINSYSSWTAAF